MVFVTFLPSFNPDKKKSGGGAEVRSLLDYRFLLNELLA